MGLGEIPIALVFSRHGHDRASAITHKHVIGEVQRNRILRERVENVGTGEHAAFIERTLRGHALDIAGFTSIRYECRNLGPAVVSDNDVDKWVFWSHDRVSHAETGVWSCGENVD